MFSFTLIVSAGKDSSYSEEDPDPRKSSNIDPPFLAFLSNYQSLFKTLFTSGAFFNLKIISRHSYPNFSTIGYRIGSL
jgi:hypothetical protein